MARASRSFRLSLHGTSNWRCLNSRLEQCRGPPRAAHAGQQCHLLLQGTVRADYGDNTYRLEEGDSILWEGTLPYRLENIGTNEARLLIATAPASLWKQAEEEASDTATPVPADSLSA